MIFRLSFHPLGKFSYICFIFFQDPLEMEDKSLSDDYDNDLIESSGRPRPALSQQFVDTGHPRGENLAHSVLGSSSQPTTDSI